MNTRIKQIIEHEGLTDAEFADRTGIKRATLSHCLNGRNDVSKDIILKIHNAYPQVSVNWLMFGEGEPYIKEKLKTPASLFDEIWAKPDDSPEDAKYVKDFQSNELRNVSDNVDSKLNKEENLNSDIETQKAQDNRKVIKIMVFYSDNTFETFSSDFFK
ncbi:MAG: helix-turn-helix transcriptional regulator [Tannerella sp.]|uniref:helix-turn-helix domain-containing protein n=1 Tax=uncultured Coprobacter sp. TaxID=1720550 RepID=UPI00261643C9|nr:helix-turn-helix transcriptional regulator [uncultured Coprobacter sp.]MBS6268535.1 helix-turn-helix transcriptional regulator [Tannerella sp.]